MLDFSFLQTDGGQTAQEGSLARAPDGTLAETGVSAGSGGIQITLGGFVVGALVGGGIVWAWKEGMFR